MKETDAALAGLLRKNLRGPFWSAFTGSWLIINAGFVWTLLFQSEQYLYKVYGVTKVDYLAATYSLSLLDGPLSFLLTKIVGPFILALGFLWVLPRLTNEFLKQHEKTKTREKQIREEEICNRIEAEINTERKRNELEKIKQSGKNLKLKLSQWRKEFDDVRRQYFGNRNQCSLKSIEWLANQWRRERKDFIHQDRFNVATLEELINLGLLQSSLSSRQTYTISEKGSWFVEWLDEEMTAKAKPK